MFLNFYKCYSISLKRFLGVNDVYPVTKGKNEKTKRKYWIYLKDEKLAELLKIYSDSKGFKDA